jgi:hypothetical protein
VPIIGPLLTFDPASLGRVPDEGGVFALYRADELIYYGHALESLRDQIEIYLLEPGCRCMQRAILFNVEVCEFPALREVQLIREHQAQFGRMPRCNEAVT